MSFGGIRASSGLSGRASAQFGAVADPTQGPYNGKPPGNVGGIQPGAAGTGFRQPASPYNTGPANSATPKAPTHSVLIGLVLAEAVALVALRRGFRHHHGG